MNVEYERLGFREMGRDKEDKGIPLRERGRSNQRVVVVDSACVAVNAMW